MRHQTPFEKNIGPRTPSSTQPIDPDKPLPIREWQQKYERYLELIGKKETRRRYARALDRFFGKHPKMTFGHEFLRPVINSYVETRLAEGASVATVRLELSAIRGLFQFAMDMHAWDVMINPGRGVKVKKPKIESPQAARIAIEKDPQTFDQLLRELNDLLEVKHRRIHPNPNRRSRLPTASRKS